MLFLFEKGWYWLITSRLARTNPRINQTSSLTSSKRYDPTQPLISFSLSFFNTYQHHDRSLKNTELKGKKTKPLKSVSRGRKPLPRKKQQRPENVNSSPFPIHLIYQLIHLYLSLSVSHEESRHPCRRPSRRRHVQWMMMHDAWWFCASSSSSFYRILLIY